MSDPFLNDPATHKALKSLAKKNSLVIYCGAGVTRDRTGLGWEDLVSEIFNAVCNSRGRDSKQDQAIATSLANTSFEPVQKASVVVQTGNQSTQSETKFLAPLLHKTLYKKHGWSQGLLLQNIAELAIFAAALGDAGRGDSVHLITTNYDDYIDRELIKTISDWNNPGIKQPGVALHIVGDTTNETVVINKPTDRSGTIYVHHIHGRVDSQGKSSGEIVFSEKSYSEARTRTVKFLASQFHEASAFLSVGASLNDAPLIEALFEAERVHGWNTSSPQKPVKVAVLTPSKGTKDEQLAALTFSQLRGEHLDIDILMAENYSQVAQFVEELEICKILAIREKAETYSTEASYPVALHRWWDDWKRTSWSTQHEQHYKILRDTLAIIRDEVNDKFTGEYGLNEVLKLEVWIRLEPSENLLWQYANSTGPLLEVSALRNEPIESQSNVASVQAFTAGKPLLRGLPELHDAHQTTRWKSFLSLPIYHNMEIDFVDFEVQRTVPVGVVTLASTLHLSSESEESLSFLANPSLTVADHERILLKMREVGERIVDPTDQGT